MIRHHLTSTRYHSQYAGCMQEFMQEITVIAAFTTTKPAVLDYTAWSSTELLL